MFYPAQQQAIDLAKLGHSMVICGGIGTGKTTTIQQIVRQLTENGVLVAVTASTGLASKQIQGNFLGVKHRIFPWL
jgi:type IV secretory pathway ATPase VirB11/archaellum biosynthesis ATPase